MAGLLGEQEIHKFFIETELHHHDHERKHNEQHGNQRDEVDQHDTYERKNDIDGDPAVEGPGMLLKALHGHTVAAAVIFKNVRHVLAGLFLPLAAGIALAHGFANVRDLFDHVLSVLFLFADDG